MSLEKIKQQASTVLLNFFQLIIKRDEALRLWQDTEIGVDNLSVIMTEIKQASLRLQKSQQQSLPLVFSVCSLEMPYKLYEAVNQSTSIADCVTQLINAHRIHAEAHPLPTRQYQYEQTMERLVKGILNDLVTQNLVDDELKERIATHLATQKIAVTSRGASYGFGFINRPSASGAMNTESITVAKKRL